MLGQNGDSLGSGPKKGSEKETNSCAYFPCRFKTTATPSSLVEILETQTLRESPTLTKKAALSIVLETYGHTMFKTLASLSGLAILANAHMKMNTPVPYGKSTLNNSPLLKSGTDFPCKLRPDVYAVEDASNVYALGSTNPLRLTGQAVHGGGSCQVSITYDSQPTRNSTWKVIKSIEGGCPAQSQIGNMGGNADAADPFEYEFTIPSDIPAGNGTIAWTWFNKIGNREMYMNCGPVTLTGTGGSQLNFDALPDMFKANINNGCDVPDNKDVAFPDPGKDVTKMNGATDAFAAPTGTSCGVAKNPGLNKPTSVFTAEPKPSQSLSPTEAPASPSLEFPKPSDGSNGNNSDSAGTLERTMCIEEGFWNCVEESFRDCMGGHRFRSYANSTRPIT